MRRAHIAFDFLTGNECGNGVNNNNINGSGICKCFSYAESLLSAVGLRYKELVDINAELLCVYGVERVLCIDECRSTALLLNFSDNVKRDSRLT